MSYDKQAKRVGYLALVGGLYTVAWYIQSRLLLNSDVSWLTLAARRLLGGGTYTHDYFEINPPMAVYLYIPIAILSHLVHLSTAVVLRWYIFILSALSLYLCTRLLDKIFLKTQTSIVSLLLFVLAVLFLIAPLSDFGQREHFLVILSAPYFLIVAARLQGKQPGTGLPIIIGILAGLGFIIKPYFLIALFLIELYYAWRMSYFLAWIRVEVNIILGIIITYWVIIWIKHSDYLLTVIPVATHLYYQKYGLPLKTMVLSEEAFFCYLSFIFYGIRYQKSAFQHLSTVLMLATIGFLLAYFMQQTRWSYHIYPMLTTSILQFSLLLGLLFKQKTIKKQEYLSIGLFVIFIVSFFTTSMSYLWVITRLYPMIFFYFFMLLAVLVLLLAFQLKKIRLFVFLPLGLVTSVIFFQYLGITIWYTSQLLLATLMLLLLISLLVPSSAASKKGKFLLLSLTMFSIFFYPLYAFVYLYDYNIAYKNLFYHLLMTMSDYKGQSIAIFSNSAEFAFPTIDIEHQVFASRFGCLGWLPLKELSAQHGYQHYPQVYQQHKAEMDYLVGAVAADLVRYKPQYIFIDVRKKSTNSRGQYFGNEQINYLKFFSLNSQFQSAWKPYHYIKSVDGQPLYKFEIYQRILPT